MRKRDLVYKIALIILLIAASATSIYAWFSLVEKTQPIIIYSGTIELDAKLYEKGDTSSEITNIIHSNVVPGDSFEYQLDVENKGTLIGELSILFNLSEASKYLAEFVTVEVKSSSNTVLFTYLFTSEEQELKYVLDLTTLQKVTIYFEVIISKDLELTDITGVNYIEIDFIEIELVQKI